MAPVSGTFRMDIVQARGCDWGGFGDKANLYRSLVSSIESKIPAVSLIPFVFFQEGERVEIGNGRIRDVLWTLSFMNLFDI